MSIYTVSQITGYLASVVKSDSNFSHLILEGEISNFKYYAKSGHCYFSLNDSQSTIRCVMFQSYASMLDFTPKDGMKVLVSASLRVYEPNGIYQLYVTDMKEHGVGIAAIALEQLKKKLAAMGVFDSARKKALPPYPENIGVVTSSSGAALQDILQILNRRYPLANVHVFHAFVQGEQAPASIVSALKKAEENCDVIILGRGGGSNEDLSAFQQEIVVMAVYQCNIPIISAVGHETDDTLTDLAADLRAPTPSAAAELCAPSIVEIYGNLEWYQDHLNECLNQKIQTLLHRLQQYELTLMRLEPMKVLQNQSAKLDSYQNNLYQKITKCITEKESALITYMTKLDALHPLKNLERGFSVITHQGKIISSCKQLSTEDEIEIQLSDGKVTAVITGESNG